MLLNSFYILRVATYFETLHIPDTCISCFHTGLISWRIITFNSKRSALLYMPQLPMPITDS